MDHDSVTADFAAALEFAEHAHPLDLAWVRSRTGLVESFDEFYSEYCYVVMASGFRARTAVTILPQVLAAAGNLQEMMRYFGNRKKCEAMCTVYSFRNRWLSLRATFYDANSLQQSLPYIGPVTKFHLARNIGLSTDHAKPDLHLVRYAEVHGFVGEGRVQEMVANLAHLSGETVGVADFALWLWLSHERGATAKDGCCFQQERRLR